MGLREGSGRVAVVLVKGLVRGADLVKYVLTENDFLLVNGVVGPTQSTMAGWVELLPFKVCVSLSLSLALALALSLSCSLSLSLSRSRSRSLSLSLRRATWPNGEWRYSTCRHKLEPERPEAV